MSPSGRPGRTDMKILVVAPESHDLKVLPEISSITAMHNVTILGGSVTARRIYDTAAQMQFDVVHFMSHGSLEGILLSDGDVLSREQISAICRITRARLLFLNSCDMSQVAAYATRHGVDFVIFAVHEIADEDAWTIPISFYRTASDQSDLSFLSAILIADSGEGVYSYAVNPDVIIRYIKEIADLSSRVDKLEGKAASDHSINSRRLFIGMVVYALILTIVLAYTIGV